MKLVKEYIILEKFTEDGDPIRDMGIGLIRQIEIWLKEHSVGNYQINKDLTISIKGDLNLGGDLDGNFPSYIKFKYVSGDVNIGHNNLTSLKGCPQIIGGWFSCNDNKLTSLEYGPKRIQTKIHKSCNYECHDNELTSLKGLPKIIPGSLWVHHNSVKFTKKDVEKAGCKVNGIIST